MTTYMRKSCSFGLPRVPFVNCRQFMYLVISLLVLRAGCGIWLYQFLIIAYRFTSRNPHGNKTKLFHHILMTNVANRLKTIKLTSRIMTSHCTSCWHITHQWNSILCPKKTCMYLSQNNACKWVCEALKSWAQRQTGTPCFHVSSEWNRQMEPGLTILNHRVLISYDV